MTHKPSATKANTGQAMFETVLMIWLITLFIAAICQVFLVHNFAFQMANNAYYSMFRSTYHQFNKPDQVFMGFDDWRSKPLRWASDDRADVPMMTVFERAIMREIDDQRLIIGNQINQGGLGRKDFFMATGCQGGYGAFAGMIVSLARLAPNIGRDYTDFTDGQGGELLDIGGTVDDFVDVITGAGSDGNPQDTWDENNGDFNHDGYNDACENEHGNNAARCRNARPW